MCGIGGYIGLRSNLRDLSVLEEMARRIEHRGPDDHGFLVWSGAGEPSVDRSIGSATQARVGFVHRRLSILDLSSAGWQPMRSADGQGWIIFNGEIYNYRELGEELARSGVVFRSGSDTEVLLEALNHWGTNAIARLRGMFAFAYLDLRRSRVLLARDHFGIKPLYSYETGGGLWFASEIKALFPVLPARRTGTAANAFTFLRHGVTDADERTLFRDVHALEPGTWTEIDLASGSRTAHRFWRLTIPPRADLSFEEAASELRRLFTRSIEWHLRSDVPVGACLSGGIDSSCCVSMMREVGGEQLDLQSFTYCAEDPRIDESAYAVRLGEAMGATTHVVSAKASALLHDLDALIAQQDEPFASTSIYAQYRLFQLIGREGVRVVLDGQGADELLGGYPIFVAARIADAVRSGEVRSAMRLWVAAGRNAGFGASRQMVAHYLAPDFMQRSLRQLVGRDEYAGWLRPRWFEDRGVSLSIPRPSVDGSLLHAELARSLTGSLRALLRYEDRNSMAASVESRVPFLLPEIAEFLLSLPGAYLIADNGTTKHLLREALRDVVPSFILNRRDKIGFQTPEHSWLSSLSPWMDDAMRRAAEFPFVDGAALKAEWGRAKADHSAYHHRLWRIANLTRWAELSGVVFE